jgi:hypothetical protein
VTNLIKQFNMAVAAIAVGLIVMGSYSALTATSARAQSSGGSNVTHIKTIGPLRINGNETVLLGLLLPAVQNVTKPARLELFDSAGRMLTDTVVEFADGSVRNAFYHLELGDGSVHFTDAAGNILASSPSTDGIVTAVLLPAVQMGGQTVDPIAASMQIVGADGTRGQVAAFADGSVRF